jgi:hypothetical protein
MKADTFAKLIVLESLIDAEIGFYLEHHPQPPEGFREGMVSRVSDLVDDIDALDAVAAARIYDAIVDFLAELPEDDDGVVNATVRFKRAVDRIIERGSDERELRQTSTWAVVLDELLGTLADEYHLAVRSGGEVRPREYLRAQVLLARSREAADRLLWTVNADGQSGFRDDMDRLTFAVRHQRLKPTAVDLLIHAPQRYARRYRPSNLTRIGAFVLGQLLRRDVARRERSEAPAPAAPRKGRRSTDFAGGAKTPRTA